MKCHKKSYRNGRLARRAAVLVSRSNGHYMRAYRCKTCSKWHLTSQSHDGKSHSVLPWSRKEETFVAPWGDGVFVVEPGWRAVCPNGVKAGPFPDSKTAKEWCEAVSYLPEERWTEVR